MSKSLGNSPDPIGLIDRFGADGLRFGIVSIAPQGQDIRFQEERVEGGRNFCNKLWNACRFRQLSGPAGDNASLEAILARLEPERFDADDHAILDHLLAAHRELERCFREFEFSAATQAVHGFFWGDFCDWYVEVSKSKLQGDATRANCLAVQDLVLRQTLLLLHPFAPFITEELWQLLGYAAAGSLLMRDGRVESAEALEKALETKGVDVDRALAQSVDAMKAFVSAARDLKAKNGQASRRDARFFVIATDSAWAALEANLPKLARMAGAAAFGRRASVPGAPAAVTSLGTLYLDLAGAVDAESEKQRLAKELERIVRHLAGAETRLANPAFVGKAPPAVLDGARKQLSNLQAKRAEIERLLKALG
jgi:valyl-tRNA synthetase